MGYTNAASSDFWNIPLAELQTPEAFEGMFANEIRGIARDPSIPDYYTTDPQAEVLVFERIPPEHIFAICTESGQDSRQLRELLPSFSAIEIDVCPKFFKPRTDYQRWKKDQIDDITLDDEAPF